MVLACMILNSTTHWVDKILIKNVYVFFLPLTDSMQFCLRKWMFPQARTGSLELFLGKSLM